MFVLFYWQQKLGKSHTSNTKKKLKLIFIDSVNNISVKGCRDEDMLGGLDFVTAHPEDDNSC